MFGEDDLVVVEFCCVVVSDVTCDEFFISVAANVKQESSALPGLSNNDESSALPDPSNDESSALPDSSNSNQSIDHPQCNVCISVIFMYLKKPGQYQNLQSLSQDFLSTTALAHTSN